MSKRSGGRRPWQEIDLNRVFNRFGYSLSWGRALFARLAMDPFFRNLCKVRYDQKRLAPPDGHGNGCFVILIAFRPYLRWDEEPLFYGHDREQTRHIRAKLRGPDLEFSISDPRSQTPATTEHCPVSHAGHIKTFSTPGTAVEKNTRASSDSESTRYAAWKNKPRTGHTTRNTEHTGEPICLKTSLATPEPSVYPTKSQTLRRKAVALTLDIKSDHWQGTKSDGRSVESQVTFSFPHAYAFVSESLRAGYQDKTIATVWQQAVHATHTEIVDANVGRRPGQHGYRPRVKNAHALNLFHARRLIAETDHLSDAQRVKRFYRSRMIETERARKHHAQIERAKSETRIEAQKILTGTSDKSVADQFRALRQSIDDGSLAALATQDKTNPIKNE